MTLSQLWLVLDSYTEVLERVSLHDSAYRFLAMIKLIWQGGSVLT
jgi:hypothetical protein